VVSVAEDELMRVLILVRNFLPGYHQVINGDWNVAGIAYRSYDLEGKTVGTVGAGRIGRLLLQRYIYMPKIGSVWHKLDCNKLLVILCFYFFFSPKKGGTTVSIYPSRSINLFVEML
jgi:D-isomer specific 2-hydroxyacid dehydrogenase, NAD binding domain